MKSMLAFWIGWSIAFAAENPNPALGAVAALSGLIALAWWARVDRAESRAATQSTEQK